MRLSAHFLLLLFTVHCSLLTFVNAAWAVNGRVIYGDSTTAWINERAWTGADFGAAGSTMTNTAAAPWWTVYKDSPVQNIGILGTQATNGQIMFQCYDQTAPAWNNAVAATCNDTGGSGNQWPAGGAVAGTACAAGTCNNATNDDYRAFDIAFEQLSGDALIVYEDSITADNPADVNILRWDAPTSTWASPNCGAAGKLRYNPAAVTDIARWITLVPRPNSNEILILIFNDDGAGIADLFTFRWNGTTDTCTTITSPYANGNLAISNESFAAAYETVSGKAVLVAGIDSTNLDMQTWTAASGAVTWTALGLPSNPEDPALAMQTIRMASNPNSNYISMIYRAAGQVRAFIWNGAAWEASPLPAGADTTAENTGATATTQAANVDTAWEHSGGMALFVYTDANSWCAGYWRYLVGLGWNVSAIGTPSTGTTTCATGFPVAHATSETFAGDDIQYLKLFPSPVTSEIMLVGISLVTTGGDIRASRWDGDRWNRMTTNLLSPIASVAAADDNYGMVAFDWVGPKNQPYNQTTYRWCNNVDSANPTAPDCPDAADTPLTGTLDWSDNETPIVRHLRIGLDVPLGATPFPSTTAIKLQYAGGIGTISDCGMVDNWTDVGAVGATNKAWRGYNNTTPADGIATTSLLATSTETAETYEESSPSNTAAQVAIAAGSTGEWGFTVENYNANAGTDYCFRIVNNSGDHFRYYSKWPKVSVATPHEGTLVYGDTANAGVPKTRNWSNTTERLSAECTPGVDCPGGAPAASAIVWTEIQQIQGAGATTRPTEKILGTSNTAATAQLNVWTLDGGVWNQRITNVNTNTLATAKSFDIAYENGRESTTDDALIVAEDAVSNTLLNYWLYDGALTGPCTWNYSTGARAGAGLCPNNGADAAQSCAGAAIANVRWVEAVPRNVHGQIMILFMDSTFDLYAVRWNGKTDTFGQCSQLANNTACNGSVIRPCFDFAWNHAYPPIVATGPLGLVAYGIGTDLEFKEFTESGGFGAALVDVAFFDPLEQVSYVRIEPDTGSPIVAGMYSHGAIGVANDDDIRFFTYDFSTSTLAQGPGTGIATAVEDVISTAHQYMDVAWETGTGQALFVYVDANDLNLKYLTYDRITPAWSVADPNTPSEAGMVYCDDIELAALRPSPSSREIMVVLQGLAAGCTASLAGDQIQVRLWDGDKFRSSETMRNVEDAPSDASAAGSQCVDFVWTRKDPTLVELVSFTGYSRSRTSHEPRATSHEVVLEWETAAERSNAGFNIYRESAIENRESIGQNRELITPKLIQGLGTSARGKRYAFVDDLRSLVDSRFTIPGLTLRYWLEDIEFNGTRTMHGPIEVHLGLDSDGDGMPDDWEGAFGCGTNPPPPPFGKEGSAQTNPSLPPFEKGGNRGDFACLDPNRWDADGDADGDGISNILEYLNGTTPTAIESAVWITDLSAFRERGRAQASCGDRSCFDKLSTSGDNPAHPELVEGWRVVREDSTGIELECEREGCLSPAMLAVPPGAKLVDSPGVTEQVDGIFRDQTVLRISAEATPTAALRARVEWSPEFRVGAGMPAQSGDQGRPYGVSSHDLTGLLDTLVLNRSRWSVNRGQGPGVRGQAPKRNEGTWLKVPVSETGVYKITRDDVAAAGLTMDSVNLETARVFVGAGLPARSEGRQADPYSDLSEVSTQSDGGALYFYGVPAENKFTRTNTYWLNLGVGDQGSGVSADILELTQPGPVDEPFQDSFLLTPGPKSLNPVLYWQEMPGPNDAERFFFTPVLKDGDSHDYEFDLPELANPSAPPFDKGGIGGISIGVTLLGLAESSVAQNHKVEVSVNGQKIGELTWQGRELYSGRLSALSDQLRSGKNALTIKVLLAEGAQFDQVLLKAATIPFFRPFRPAVPIMIPSPFVGARHASPLQEAANRADYIMILPATNPPSPPFDKGGQGGDFSDAVSALKAYHESRGLTVKVVTLDQIYDEFGAGVESPHAIKSFLAYAFRNWQAPKPSYVLLVGDATYDYKGYEPRATSHEQRVTGYVPTYLLYTPLGGEIPSDAWFVSFDDCTGESCLAPTSDRRPATSDSFDLFPDMAIGRLPARTPDELSAMVDKILHYADDDPESDWRRNVLLVADNFVDSFEGISESLFDLAPGSLLLTRGYMSLFPSPADLNVALVKEINSGAGLINYVGHGSAQYWGAEKLLAPDQLAQLENLGRYPFISTLTCINGYFVFPPEQEFEAMAEEYVRAPGRGAVAFFAPSGMSSPAVHGALNRALYKAITQDRVNPIGAAIQKAYLDVAGQISAGRLEYVPQMFVLFGDPAMDLVLPTSDAPPARVQDPIIGDCLCVQIGAPGGWGGGVWTLSLLLGLYTATRLLRRRRIP